MVKVLNIFSLLPFLFIKYFLILLTGDDTSFHFKQSLVLGICIAILD